MHYQRYSVENINYALFGVIMHCLDLLEDEGKHEDVIENELLCTIVRLMIIVLMIFDLTQPHAPESAKKQLVYWGVTGVVCIAIWGYLMYRFLNDAINTYSMQLYFKTLFELTALPFCVIYGVSWHFVFNVLKKKNFEQVQKALLIRSIQFEMSHKLITEQSKDADNFWSNIFSAKMIGNGINGSLNESINDKDDKKEKLLSNKVFDEDLVNKTHGK